MYREAECNCWPPGKEQGQKNNEQFESYAGCCGWGGRMGFHRQFVSGQDKISRLEEYLKQVQAEAKGVEERIAELKKTKEE